MGIKSLMTEDDFKDSIDVTKYIWCKQFKLSDFPECCKNCKHKTCDSEEITK